MISVYTRILLIVMMILLSRFVSEINDGSYNFHRLPVAAAEGEQVHSCYYVTSRLNDG